MVWLRVFVFFESHTHCACIVVYASYTAATRSLKELNGVPLNGRSILVAKPKQHYFFNLYVHKQEADNKFVKCCIWFQSLEFRNN